MDEAAIEQAWRGPFKMLTRGMRRSYVAMSAVIGVFFWFFLPLSLIGAIFGDENRREALGYVALCFGLGLAAITVAVALHHRFAPEHRAEDTLRREGVKVAGRLLKQRYVPAMGKIPLNSHYLFGAEVPGGPPVFARLTARNGIAVGTPATIAFDPARPGEGVVVETAGELRRRARSR